MRFEFTYAADDLREARRIANRTAAADANRASGRRTCSGQNFLGWMVALALVPSLVYVARLGRPPSGLAPPPTNVGSSTTPFLWALSPAAPALVVAYGALLYWRSSKKKSDRLLTSPVAVEVSDDGVIFIDGPERIVRQWRAFDRFVETDRRMALRVTRSGNGPLYPFVPYPTTQTAGLWAIGSGRSS